MVEIPNPGTPEAVEQGCTCPVLDNNHGSGIVFTYKDGTTRTAYWINGECKLHNGKTDSAEKSSG